MRWMMRKDDDLGLIAEVYQQARRDGLDFDQAFASAFERFCAARQRPADRKAYVDVGVTIGDAQMKRIFASERETDPH